LGVEKAFDDIEVLIFQAIYNYKKVIHGETVQPKGCTVSHIEPKKGTQCQPVGQKGA